MLSHLGTLQLVIGVGTSFFFIGWFVHMVVDHLMTPPDRRNSPR